RRMYANVIVDTRRPKVRPGKTVVQRTFGRYRPRPDRPLHKDAVPAEQALEFFQHRRILGQEFLELLPCRIGKITFEPADPAHIGRQPRTTDLLIDLIDQFAVLHHVQKPRKGTGVHTHHRITDQVVGDPRQLHDDHPEIVDAFRRLDPEQFLAGDMPSHIIYRR